MVRIDLEPLGGIAGDMFAAAFFNAFPHLYNSFCEDLSALGVEGLSAGLEERLSNGLQAGYFTVVQNTTQKPPRTLAAVQEFFKSTPVAADVADHAVGIFTRLAHAEAQVHGQSLETIHFHEVSDWDSVVDIIAAAGIIARLNCPVWRVGVLPLGGGSVNTAHGDIPVPAPATLAMLKGFQWQDDGLAGERVTPTGAAILAYLKATPLGVATAAAKFVATGSGCGTRILVGRANILRIIAFSSAVELSGQIQPGSDQTAWQQDEVVRTAFEVDDMTAEEIAWAADKLRNTEGVLDVACVTMAGKKNRVSTGFRVIAEADFYHAMMKRCFDLTSTIGVRYSTVQRAVLDRAEWPAASGSVKIVTRPDGELSAKVESDDLSPASTLTERRLRAQKNTDSALQLHRSLNSDLRDDEN